MLVNPKLAEKLQSQPKRWKYQIPIALIVAILLAWSATAIEYRGITERGPMMALNILKGIINPDTHILFGFHDQSVPYLLIETLSIAFLGTIIGTILAIPLSFLSARNVAPRPVTAVMNIVIILIRTVPAFVYGLMFIRVTGPGAFAGVMTMSLTSIGMLTKRNTEVVEDLDKGVIESLDAAGCTRFQKIRYGVLPQLFSNFISNTIYRFDLNMKDASVLGLVGAGGIGAPLIFNMSLFRWNVVGALLIGLMIMVLIVEVISTRLRTKLARG